MAEQTSRLAVIIDSSGAQKNTETLASSLAKLTQAGQKAASGAGKVTKATEEEAKALSDLLDRIDPVNAALNKLDKQQQQLAKFKSKGFLDTETFDTYNSKIEAARNKLAQISGQMTKTGMSAKQTAWAMRMIPAQMTDIVVGLSTGQSPFMVMMQQGGQLKDMFGGIGPAIKGTATYVAGLVGPFTLAAGAVGIFGTALYSAEKQASALNQATNSLTNISGMNLSQMTAIAQGASALGVSYGDAVTSVGLLSQAISTNADMYPQVIKASSDYSKASGQDLNDIIGMFSQLSDSSGKSIDALDDKLGFLTVAQRKQADEALRSGNIADAQRIAFDALSGKLEDLTKRLNQGATGWDNFWHSVGRGTSSTWETFKEVVGGDYLDNADVRRYQQRTQQRGQAISLGKWTSDDEQHYQMLNKASSAVQSYIKANEDLTTATKNAAGQSYLKTLNSDVNANADAVTKARKAIVALDNQFKSQPSSIQSQGRSDYQARRLQLEQSLADAQQAADRKNQPPKQRQGKAYSEDAGTKLIDQLNQQHASLTAQLDTSTKIGTSQQALIKWEQQLADIKSKSVLTADQKSLLANQKKITALYQQNAAIEKTKELQAQQQKITAFNNQLLKESSQYADQLNTKLAGAGLGTKEQQRAQELLALRQQASQKQSDLTDRYNDKSTGMTPEMYQKETDLINQDLQRRVTFLRAYYVQADAMEANWQAGVTSGLQDFVDQNSDYMTMASEATSEILNGLSDSISDNFTSILNGTESFKKGMSSLVTELGQDIIKTLIQMATQALITKAIMGIGGSLFGGGASSGNAGTALSSIGGGLDFGLNLPGFAVGGYTGPGGKYQPGGIVHKGEYVFDQSATNRIGVSNLEAIRKNGLDATLSRPGFGTGAKNVSNNHQATQHNTFHQTIHMPQNSGITPEQLDVVMKRNNAQLTKDFAAQTASGDGIYGRALRKSQGRGNRMT